MSAAMRPAALLLLLVVLAGACTPSRSQPQSQQQAHVFVIVMENHSAEQAMSGQFISSLASTYGVAENYHAVAHPSVPNYLALTSGSTWGADDDSCRVLPRRDIGTPLTSARASCRSYTDGVPA